MEVIRNRKEWKQWCSNNYESWKESRPPEVYPVAAIWHIDGGETTYPVYYTIHELATIICDLTRKS